MSGIVLSGTFSCTLNLWVVYGPAARMDTDPSGAVATLGAATAGVLVCGVLAPVVGAVSDQIGRRCSGS